MEDNGRLLAQCCHLQDVEVLYNYISRWPRFSFYHLYSTIVELTSTCPSLMYLHKLNAPRSPSALEVAVLGLALGPRRPTANRLPTDWRSGRVPAKAS